MVHRNSDLPPASIAALDALSLLSGKWQPVVLAVLTHRGPLGFNDLLEEIPGVSGKVLTATLEQLQEADLVERTVVSRSPLRVEYELTPAGDDLAVVFDELATWGERHYESAIATVLAVEGDRRLTEMYSRWLNDRYTVLRAHSVEEIEARRDAGIDVALVATSVPGGEPNSISSMLDPDCRVVLLVEERPNMELLGVDCDEILKKPVVRETLVEVVEDQLTRLDESLERRELSGLARKRTLFESTYPPEALARNDAYTELTTRLRSLEERLEA